MTDVVVEWDWPEVASDQKPISEIYVDFRVSEGLEWTRQDEIPYPDGGERSSLTFSDFQSEQIFVRLIVVDVDGVAGAPLVVYGSATVEYRPPGQARNVTVRFV